MLKFCSGSFGRFIVGIAITYAAFGPQPSTAATLQCRYLPQLFELYLKNHYAIKTLTPEVKAHTTEQFVKNLDPSKMLLLDSDVNKLKTSVATVFDSMAAGGCAPLDESTKILLTRAEEDEQFVKTFMGPNYKLDEKVELVLDPKKRGYAKTLEEKRETLKKMLHFQIFNYLQSKMKLPEAKKHLIHRYELIAKRLKERKADDTLANYVEAFALALDPHSGYLSKDNLEDFRIQMQLSLEGIGASLTTQDGFTVIEELIPGGGAAQLKKDQPTKELKPKDKIIAVAQEGGKPTSVIDMDLRDVVKLIRGKSGTKVTLTILRQATSTTTFNVTIKRAKIDVKDQAAKLTYETRKVGTRTVKIGIIDLPSFYGGGGSDTRSCSTDTRKLLEEAMKNKVDGVLLNVSTNGGGLLEEAVKLSGLFIKKGGVVATKDTQSKPQVLIDEDDDTVYSGPLALYTSRLSASAAEILAGALKDYKRALIIGGDHTFGKGSVQVVTGLPLDLGGMKVTTGMFFLPGGDSTQWTGVASNIVLPPQFPVEDIGEKTLDYSLPPQKIENFVSADADATDPAKHWQPVTEAIVTKLTEKSKVRVAKDPAFAELKKTLEESEKNAGVIKLAELKKKSDEDKKKKKPGEKEKKKLEDSPLVQESVNILTDYITEGGEVFATKGASAK